MRDYPKVIPANSQASAGVGGNFIKLKSSTADVRVIAENKDGREVANLRMTEGTSIRIVEDYIKVRIENETASDVNCTLILGRGDVQDSELSGSVSISNAVDVSGSTITASLGTSISNASHTVGVAAALLLAANSAARSIVIQNNASSGDIYIGNDATVTTANGLKISAGQALTIDKAPQAAIYAIGSIAGLDCRTLSELN